jgi:hypothetical protein
MENIYQQAVLDAKAVRASAMANAKATIQEAFEPKIKAMLKKHIVESEDYNEEYKMEEAMATDLDLAKVESILNKASKTKPDPKSASPLINTLYKRAFIRDLKTISKIVADGPENFDNYFDTIGELGDQRVGFEGFPLPEPWASFDSAMDYSGAAYENDYNDLANWLTNFKAAVNKFPTSELSEGYEDGMEEESKEMEEAEYADPSLQMDPGNLDETALDEILAELEAMTQDESDEEEDEEEDEMDESLNESEEDEMDEAKDEEDAEEEAEEDEDEEGEATGDETKVVDITLGDLVDAIKAAMATENGAAMADADASEDDNISLDEILAELEDESEEDEMDEYGADGGYLSEKKKDKERIVKTGKAAVKASEKETAYSKELEEAKKAIAAMRSELNEVNLLNAKLLYVNKIFKSKSLTESQKVKVLNAFDRATTVKEVKNVYATINESVSAAPKTQLKESYGFASKPTGYTQKTNTVESDPFIARMQKLAGL